MRRDLDYTPERDKQASDHIPTPGISRGSQSTSPQSTQPSRSADVREQPDALRTWVQSREITYKLRPSALNTLKEISYFREIPTQDLATYFYKGDRAALARDLQDLEKRGLIKRLVSSSFSTADRSKISQEKARELTAAGAKDIRIVQDFTLRARLQKAFSTLPKSFSPVQRANAEQTIAARQGVKIQGGKTLIPPIRIEYRLPNGQKKCVHPPLSTSTQTTSEVLRQTPAGIEVMKEIQKLKPRTINEEHLEIRVKPSFRLRPSEIQLLQDVGKFRSVHTGALIKFGYVGDYKRYSDDLRNLMKQGLVRRYDFEFKDRAAPRTMKVLTLTSQGKDLVQTAARLPQKQQLYVGLAKPKEIRHDAALYEMYKLQEQKLLAAGGKPLRVILDFELKRTLNAELAKLKSLPASLLHGKQQQLAERYGLTVVAGKIPLPDLQIEYSTHDDQIARVNLELVTKDYRDHSIAEKYAAGFKIYAHNDRAFKVYSDDILTRELTL